MPLRAYEILNTKIKLNPLKLAKYITNSVFLHRLEQFCINAAGLTGDDINDPAYKDLLKMYEKQFFALDYKPVNEPSGIENLSDFLKGCVEGKIDWNKFIKDKLKGKTPDKQIEIYNEIRNTGFKMYEDFMSEFKRLRISDNQSIN